MTQALLAFAAVAGVSWLLTGAVRAFALRAGLLDVPNDRSLHRTPTPRGGGLAIVIVTIAGLIAAARRGLLPAEAAWGLTVGGALVALIGYLDDRGEVRASTRAVVHTVAASWAGYWIWGEISAASLAGVFCLMWAINLYNFMDGIDGLAGAEAASVGAVAGLLLAAGGRSDLALVAFLVSAAATGFLGWNWPPAKIFMGDVGSGFLGYVFGVLSLLADRSGALPLALGLLLAGVFAFDATITLLRRTARRERWSQAHRTHAYQRLVQAGRSHAAVTSGVVALNLGLGGLAWLAQSGRISITAAVLAGVLVLSVLYLAIERRRPMYPDAPGRPTLP